MARFAVSAGFLVVGIVLMVGSVACMAGYSNADTTVAETTLIGERSYPTGNHVHNTGLMAQQQVGVLCSGFFLVTGAVFFSAGFLGCVIAEGEGKAAKPTAAVPKPTPASKKIPARPAPPRPPANYGEAVQSSPGWGG